MMSKPVQDGVEPMAFYSPTFAGSNPVSKNVEKCLGSEIDNC
jgi:hypothetical protein